MEFRYINKYKSFNSPQTSSPPTVSPTQPIYVMPGETPVYMDTNTGASVENTQLLHSQSSSKAPLLDPRSIKSAVSVDSARSPPIMLYEDVNQNPSGTYECFDNLTESMYEDPGDKPFHVEDVYDDPVLPEKRTTTSSINSSSAPSLPLPPIPRNSFSPASPQSPPSGVYMTLNPSTIDEGDLYASPNLVNTETDPEYVSITNQYVQALKNNPNRLNSEADYV